MKRFLVSTPGRVVVVAAALVVLFLLFEAVVGGWFGLNHGVTTGGVH